MLATLMRLQGLNFGLPALLDPDEPFFMITALKLLRNHTLNPGWFGHPGTTTIYCLAIIQIAVYLYGLALGLYTGVEGFASAVYRDPGLIVIPARLFFVGCGVLCVFLTFSIGRRLFGDRVGAIAALVLAINPLHIKWSQIVRTDIQATVFMLLCLQASMLVAERGKMRDYLLAGALVGLACATKWPTGIVILCPIAAGGLRLLAAPERARETVARIAAALATVPITLFAVSPYLLIDSATALTNIGGEQALHHLGATGGSFLWNLGWYISVPIGESIGWLGLALSAIGIVVAGRNSRPALALLIPPALCFLLLICTQRLIWARWVLPLLPFTAIFIAVALQQGAVWLARLAPQLPAKGILGIQGVLLAVLGLPMALTAQAQARERDNDTRIRASAWAITHVPPGSTVMLEHLGLDLQARPWQFRTPAGAAGCVDAGHYLKGKISADVIGGWRGGAGIVDLGTMDPSTLDSCRADIAILSDWDRYSAEPAFYREELAVYAAYTAKGRIVATFRPVAGQSGGPVVRIVAFDHHRVSAP